MYSLKGTVNKFLFKIEKKTKTLMTHEHFKHYVLDKYLTALLVPYTFIFIYIYTYNSQFLTLGTIGFIIKPFTV